MKQLQNTDSIPRSGLDVAELAGDVAVFLNGVHDPASEVPAFIESIVRSGRDEEQLIRLFADLDARPESEWIVQLLKGYAEGALTETADRLIGTADTDLREGILQTLPAFGEAGKQAASELVEKTGLAGDQFFKTEPVKQIQFFAAIGDRRRLHEVHSRLMREAESDIFHQRGLERYFPTLHQRHKIPEVFAGVGRPDLAAALFRKYHDTIRSYSWDHQLFLTSYLRFLIEQGHYEEAESVFTRVTRKSLRVDLRLLAQLYKNWGKLDEWEERTAPMYLSTGNRILMSEWTTALAEGREMVEYKPVSW